MLKEQLLGFAMKAYSQAYETKERIKKNLKPHVVQDYVQIIKKNAVRLVEKQIGRIVLDDSEPGVKERTPASHSQKFSEAKTAKRSSVRKKRERKSSIKPAQEIHSEKATQVFAYLQKNSVKLISKSDAIDGKKSLAYLIWALGHAEHANLKDGISVHDVSALLYMACKIQLYPINISRVLYSNASLIRQVGQEKRTKTYLLTPEGLALFNEKYL